MRENLDRPARVAPVKAFLTEAIKCGRVDWVKSKLRGEEVLFITLGLKVTHCSDASQNDHKRVRVFQKKPFFQKKIRLPPHVPLRGIYNPDPKAVWTSLRGHTT